MNLAKCGVVITMYFDLRLQPRVYEDSVGESDSMEEEKEVPAGEQDVEMAEAVNVVGGSNT